MGETEKRSARLEESEVRARVDACEDSEVLDELYSFGIQLSQGILDRVKALEVKATSFAAYGGAVVSILVATSKNWTTYGNLSSSCIAFSAGLCGLCCNIQAVRALSLRQIETISQDEWLNRDCLNDGDLLKRFRVVTLWGVIDSRSDAEDTKAKRIREAEVWLASSLSFLVLLILQVAIYAALKENLVWVVLCPRTIWVACWYLFVRTAGALGASVLPGCGLLVGVVGALSDSFSAIGLFSALPVRLVPYVNSSMAFRSSSYPSRCIASASVVSFSKSIPG